MIIQVQVCPYFGTDFNDRTIRNYSAQIADCMARHFPKLSTKKHYLTLLRMIKHDLTERLTNRQPPISLQQSIEELLTRFFAQTDLNINHIQSRKVPYGLHISVDVTGKANMLTVPSLDL